jgi:hypothetical protein
MCRRKFRRNYALRSRDGHTGLRGLTFRDKETQLL